MQPIPLFHRAYGDALARLPAPIVRVHDIRRDRIWHGEDNQSGERFCDHVQPERQWLGDDIQAGERFGIDGKSDRIGRGRTQANSKRQSGR